MYSITKGSKEELNNIIEIDYHSYCNQFAEYVKRDFVDVLSYYEKNPEGLFIAKKDKDTVGFIFTRIWGKVGWCGPSSVLPEYQHRGIGTELLRHGFRFIAEKKCDVFGFETLPENVILYTNSNTIPKSIVFYFKKNILNNNLRSRNLISIFPVICLNIKQKIKNICTDLYDGLDISSDLCIDENLLNGKTYFIYYKESTIGFFSVKRNGAIAKITNLIVKKNYKVLLLEL